MNIQALYYYYIISLAGVYETFFEFDNYFVISLVYYLVYKMAEIWAATNFHDRFIYKMSKHNFQLLLLSNEQSKIQRLFIYYQI